MEKRKLNDKTMVIANEDEQSKLFQKIVEYTLNTQTYENGSRSEFVRKLAINCQHAGIFGRYALKFIQQDFNYDSSEVEIVVRSVYNQDLSGFGKLAKNELDEIDEKSDLVEMQLNTPFIPETVYQLLPDLLKQCCEHFPDPRERDIFLTGAITVLSGCFHEVKGFYASRIIWPNLFSFIVAPPASGKGALFFAKELGMAYHRSLILESSVAKKKYQAEVQKYNTSKKNNQNIDYSVEPDPPIKPKSKILYIPGNSSSAAIIQHLDQSGGIGIIFETEADTLGNNIKQEWGSFSDILRKAFQHEPISYSRKLNDEYIEVENSRISLILSGTPSQVPSLITSSEDGLFSRFIFYFFRAQPHWRDVSPNRNVNMAEHFATLSERVNIMTNYLSVSPTEFHLSDVQWSFLNNNFSVWLKQVSTFVSADATSTVIRLGIITFRIAMIFSAIRKFEQHSTETIISCSDDDFRSALMLAEVYKEHALLMFATLPKAKDLKLDSNKQKFFNALPTDRAFSRKEAVDIGAAIGIRPRTVGKYLHIFLDNVLGRDGKYGSYRKIV